MGEEGKRGDKWEKKERKIGDKWEKKEREVINGRRRKVNCRQCTKLQEYDNKNRSVAKCSDFTNGTHFNMVALQPTQN